MSRRCSSRLGPSCMRAMAWIWSRISRVAGQVAGPVAILDAELLGGLALGGEVLGFGPLVHHLGGQKGNLPPDAFVGHG